MATLVGKVGIVMKGNYNSASTYEALDAVSYAGSLYIAKQSVPANTLPTNTTYWQAAASWTGAAVDISSAFTLPSNNAMLGNVNATAHLLGNLVVFTVTGLCVSAESIQNKDICIIDSPYRPNVNRVVTGFVVLDYTSGTSESKVIPVQLDSINSKIRTPNQGGLVLTVTNKTQVCVSGSYYI